VAALELTHSVLFRQELAAVRDAGRSKTVFHELVRKPRPFYGGSRRFFFCFDKETISRSDVCLDLFSRLILLRFDRSIFWDFASCEFNFGDCNVHAWKRSTLYAGDCRKFASAAAN
jgi:hypothetical protein